MIYDVAVVIPTILRPSLGRAVRSIYAQDFGGTVQIMLGVDTRNGPPEIIEELKAECPNGWALTVLDLGYSTSHLHGGIYKSNAGGALRTALSYMANSQFIAYLDDDNWWAPDHLKTLRQAIGNADWAFSLRWWVDPRMMEPYVLDQWESLGPGKGTYRDQYGGFVDTNCLMLNKAKCHWDLPAWCLGEFGDGTGQDRMLFRQLVKKKDVRSTGKATVYYVQPTEKVEENLAILKKYREDQADADIIYPPGRDG